MEIINWVLALHNYFFSRETEERVFLYVDEQILDQIGAANGLGDHNSFVNTFLVFGNEDRIRIYEELSCHKMRYVPQRTPADNRQIFTPNILNFALFLAERTGYPYYFPYVVLAMYFASNAMRNNHPIGRYLKHEFSIQNYRSLEDLFDRLNRDQPAFSNERRTQERFIGLLKYQLILRPSEITEIIEALDRISYVEDSCHTYVDVIRRLRDFVNPRVRELLTCSLSERDYQYRIKGILAGFDLESYRREHQGDTARIREEEFALFLVFSRGSGRGFRLLSSFRPHENISYGRFSFTPSIDRIEDYNDKYVKVNDSEKVELQGYELEAEGLKIRPVPLGDIVFFYKYDEGRYFQSRKAYPGRKVYVFVRRNAIERWNAWARDHARNCCRKDESYDVSDLTQGNWALYCADGLNASYWEARDNLVNTVRDISKRGGIRCPGERNVYLMNALPYFEFPATIRKEGLTVTVKREGDELTENQDYKCYLQGNRLFIDIIENTDYSESKEIKVSIHYVDPDTGDVLDTGNNYEGDPVFYIRGQAINYSQDGLYRFNKWGDRIMEADSPYIQGNQIVGINECPLGNTRRSIDDLQDFSEISWKSFYFINLLSSCVYMEGSAQITRERFNSCISYASIWLGLDEERIIPQRVIRMLVNSGYISADYETRHYQAIPPAFIKIPRIFHPAAAASQVWMLTGAFTRLFLKDLVSFCTARGFQLKLRYPDLTGYDRQLQPPILLIDIRFDPVEFRTEYPYHSFDIKQNVDQSLGLLSLVPSISRYRATMTQVRRDRFTAALMDPVSDVFPRIRWDNPNRYNRHYYIEESEGQDYLKPSVSENWNDLYCHYRRQIPFVIYGKEHIYLLTRLSLPSLIQRSLFIMNVGMPSFQKAFVCASSSGSFYENVKVYKVNAQSSALLIERLTGNGMADNPLVREKIATRFGGFVHFMELWQRKDELNNKLPKELLVLKYRNNITQQIVAVSTSPQESYVMRENHLLQVIPSCNSIMSQILSNPRWQYTEIEFADNPVEFSMPDRDQYNIETISIL